MGVIYPDDRAEFWAPATDGCYYCGKAVPHDTVGVFWIGAGESIILHPTCAATWGAELIADGREALLASGIAPWDRRAIFVLRHLLRSQEGHHAGGATPRR